MHSTDANSFLYTKKSDDGLHLVIIIYVDGIMIMSHHDDLLRKAKEKLCG